MRKLLVFCLFIISLNAYGKLNVVATTHELGWLISQIGAEHVEVTTLLTGMEDPHYVDAVPSFIQRVANANLVISVGLGLESAWLGLVIRRSGNLKVQDQNGHLEVGKVVDVIKDHQGHIDRSMGDVHPEGNPHFWLSPPHMKQAARGITKFFVTHKKEHEEFFNNNLRTLLNHLDDLESLIFKKLKFLPENFKVIEYHKEFGYFFQTFGINSLDALEEFPGVPPSAGRIARVSKKAQSKKVNILFASSFHSHRHLRRFKELSLGIPYLQHSSMMQESSSKHSYQNFLLSFVDAMKKALD